MCDLVGKSFEMQAVLKPASERPKAAYQDNNLSEGGKGGTYSESGTAGTDDDCVVSVIDNGVVADAALSLQKRTQIINKWSKMV